ncbi:MULTISPECIES: endonuclease/exonuclease/phosphatase family protein [Streptococcus]|uniref:Hydrolase n=2 Tax=Streptococcus TaxID=1301 RepID=A0A7X1RNZ2_STRMT|nr:MULTISPECIES: endonuclease/exonuclease/phosphatase family protein [Streptococcus]MDI1473782.1 endonuclease/exonuclease/phosphatase family protein [Streptococcus sp. ST22-14]MQQ52900.1 hydrolase [Streptococcus mitis]
MKFLTLNTHSWMEKDPEQKFQLLLQDILKNSYDLICFQEINQEITSAQVEAGALYQPLPSAEPIHQDHYVRLLVEKLAEQGQNYYWTWAYNHIGYDRYHEGVAILSKTPIEAREILVSDVDDPTDYHTRRVALAETVVEGKELAVASVHLSWWDKGFQEEWARFEAVLKELNKPLLLAGDFNNPAGQEGYQAILASPLNLQDAFEAAKERSGSYTVPPEIDGWKGNSEPLRIDYIFTTKDMQVENLHVVFDGKNSPQVSDHYGLQAELAWKD